jgi:hypothetical protein
VTFTLLGLPLGIRLLEWFAVGCGAIEWLQLNGLQLNGLQLDAVHATAWEARAIDFSARCFVLFPSCCCSLGCYFFYLCPLVPWLLLQSGTLLCCGHFSSLFCCSLFAAVVCDPVMLGQHRMPRKFGSVAVDD